MSIVYFDNFKFDNTTATIPSTKWGVFTAEGAANLTNAYPKNGYSNNGLDLSVTTASSTHGSYYASKTGITLNNTNLPTFASGLGRVGIGFSLSEYAYSGSQTVESSALASLPTGLTNVTAAYNSDGSHLLVSFRDSSNTNRIMLYTRNTMGADGYTYWTSIFSQVQTTLTMTKIRFSPDGMYFLMLLTGATSNVYIYKRDIGANTYTNITSYGITGTVTDCVFTYNNSFIIVGGSTPYVNFYLKTVGSDTWTKTANPATLPPAGARAVSVDVNSGYIYVATQTSVSAFLFSTSIPTYQPVYSLSGLTNVTSIDTNQNTDNKYMLVGSSSAPYMQIYTIASGMPSVALPEALTAPVKSILYNPNKNKYTVLFTGSYQPKVYKISNGSITSYPNSYPIDNYNQIAYSSDNNYVVLSSNTNIVRYDNQINVIAVIAPGNYNGNTLSDNYNYANGPSRFSITLEDNSISCTYFSSTTGGSFINGIRELSADAVGYSNGVFSNVYIELIINSTSDTGLTNALLYIGSKSLTIYAGVGTYNNFDISEFKSFLSGPISICFKRDVNTSSQVTLPMKVSDMYIIDGSGLENYNRLGACSVVSEPLTSDNTVQWNSTGSNNYSVLSGNPPTTTSYTSSNVMGASDIINIDSTLTSNAYASKVSGLAKISSPLSGGGLALRDGLTVSAKKILTTDYTVVDQHNDIINTYVAIAANSTLAPITVQKLTKFNDGTNIPVIGYASDAAKVCVLSSDASLLLVGYASAVGNAQAFTLNNGAYSPLTNPFPDIAAAVTAIDISSDNKYIALSALTNVYVYKNNFNGTFTRLSTLAMGYTYNALKFSKGGNYIFANTNGAGGKTIKFNSSAESFSILTTFTGNWYCVDTTITVDGLAEYVAFGLAVAPYINVYKINNDDTFTLATTSTQTVLSAVPVGIVLAQSISTSTASSYVSVGVAGSTNVYISAYNPVAATVGAATVATNSLPLSLATGSAPAGLLLVKPQPTDTFTYLISNTGSSVIVQYCSGNTISYPASAKFTYATLSVGPPVRVHAVTIRENATTIGYTYS